MTATTLQVDLGTDQGPIQVDLDTERDGYIFAFFDALPEPYRGKVFALALGLDVYRKTFDYVLAVLGWPVCAGTEATADQLGAVKAAMAEAGLWSDDKSEGD